MKKSICKILATVLFAALLAGQMQTSVYAKTLSTKEKNVYRSALEDILDNSTKFYYPTFALADIDNDGKKEVVVGYNSDVSGSSACACGLVLNYENAKLVKSEYGSFASGYVNGYFITEGTTPVGGEKTSYYKITSKGKLQLAASTTSTYTDGDSYQLNKKETTKKKFDQYIKKNKLNKTAKKLEFRDLTQSALDEVFPKKESSESVKAKAAFQKYIDKKSYLSDGEEWVTLDEYAFVDVNNDGVVEMIMRQNLVTDYLYAYVNGKVKFVGQMDHSANASGTYCNKKGIIYESAYRQSSYYYFNGKTLKLRAEENNGSYYVNGKETTWEKFDAAVGELRKNASFHKIDDLSWTSLAS